MENCVFFKKRITLPRHLCDKLHFKRRSEKKIHGGRTRADRKSKSQNRKKEMKTKEREGNIINEKRGRRGKTFQLIGIVQIKRRCDLTKRCAEHQRRVGGTDHDETC